MPAQVEKLREKKLLTIDDGASIVDLSKYGMPPCLILKRDGSTLYPFTESRPIILINVYTLQAPRKACILHNGLRLLN